MHLVLKADIFTNMFAQPFVREKQAKSFKTKKTRILVLKTNFGAKPPATINTGFGLYR